MREPLHNRRINQTQTFERDGIRITLTVGFYPNGTPGEIFLNADRADSMLDVLMSDAAIIASLALQNGVTLEQIAHALKRDKFGIASSPFGAAIDRISDLEVIDAEK